MSTFGKPAFTTKRLRVFKATIVPDPACHHFPRDFFFACRTDIDCPMVVVSATCWKLPAGGPLGDGVMVELIETSALHRRMGLARELWDGIAGYYGCELMGDAATEDGERFLASMDNAKAPSNG